MGGKKRSEILEMAEFFFLFLPPLERPRGVRQTKEYPLIWSPRGPPAAPPQICRRPPTLKSQTSCLTSGSSRASASQNAPPSTSLSQRRQRPFFLFPVTWRWGEEAVTSPGLSRPRSSPRDSPPASAVLSESPWEPAHRKLFLVIPEHLGWAGLGGRERSKIVEVLLLRWCRLQQQRSVVIGGGCSGEGGFTRRRNFKAALCAFCLT